MERFALLAAALFGFLAVGFGAFGAHGLKKKLAGRPERLEWWNTGAQYQGMHALALGLSAYVCMRSPSTAASIAPAAFIVGILLFSGSLYVMTLTGIRKLGAVTPLGGLAFLVGWASLGVASLYLQ